MHGNRMYLVCQHCPQPADALILAERAGNDAQFTAECGTSRMDKWLAAHQKCGKGCDKFTVAYLQPKDWDVSPDATDTTAGAVRMALLNGSDDGRGYN